MAQLLEFYRNFQLQKTPKSNQPTTPPASPRDSLPDEELTELERIIRYCKSSAGLQRLIHVKILADVAQSAGYEQTRKLVIPMLETLSSDPEPLIRQHLCFQIPLIAKFCATHGMEEGYKVVIDIILPVIAHLLEDEKQDIRQAASTALFSYSEILSPLDLGQHVLTVVLQLAHDDLNEDMRVTAVELLNTLSIPLGFDLCRQFIIPEIISLIEDPSFQVRRSIALNYYNICKISGEYELFEKLMPGFVKLSKDDIFRVRRACAECLYDIAKFVDLDIKVGVLVEIFLRLAEDPSTQVKEVLFMNSGKFISTLPSRVINKAVLSHYLGLIDGPLGDMVMDSELQVACAYSFPGVLLAMEKERWPELRRLYHTLVSSVNVNIRKTLAASLHEVGRVLGPVITEEELIPVFEELIQDVESVRMGVIKYISSLIELLSIPCRVSYVPVLRDILLAASPFNWRLRQMIASQFKDLVPLLPIQNLYATLFPLAITLIQDRIAEVRYSIIPGIAKMMTVVLPGYQPTYFLEEFSPEGTMIRVQPPPISENEINYMEAIVLAINALIVSDAYIYRQVWCELAAVLLLELPSSIFEKYFMEGIIQLTSDPITNVRVKVAELLTQWKKYEFTNPWEEENSQETRVNPWRWLLSQMEVRRCIERLSRDDRDVYNCLKKLQPLFPDIEFVEISCRGLKSAPGGSFMGSPREMADIVEGSNHENTSFFETKDHSGEMETDHPPIVTSASPIPPAANDTLIVNEDHVEGNEAIVPTDSSSHSIDSNLPNENISHENQVQVSNSSITGLDHTSPDDEVEDEDEFQSHTSSSLASGEGKEEVENKHEEEKEEDKKENEEDAELHLKVENINSISSALPDERNGDVTTAAQLTADHAPNLENNSP